MAKNVVRWVRRLALAVLALELAWLVIANLLLAGPLSDWLSRRPERMVIRWERAHSLYPTHVSARGFVLRRQAPRLQWMVRVPEVEGRIGLLPLLRKRVELRGLHGRGLVVHARHRLDAGDFSDRAPHMPPVEGLANPPAAKPEELYPAAKGGWRTRFVGVEASDIAEIWVDHVRVGPGLHASGDAEIVNRHHYELEDLEITLDGVDVHVAGEAFAEGLEGRAALALAPIPMPRRIPDDAPLPLPLEDADLDLELRGKLETTWLFGLLTERLRWLALDGGEAQVEVRLSAVDGVLEAPGSAHLEFPALRIGLASVAVDGGATIDWTLAADGAAPKRAANGSSPAKPAPWSASVVSEQAALTTRDGARRLVDLGTIRLDVDGAHRELARFNHDLALAGRLDGGSIADVSAWNALLPRGIGVELEAGRGTVSGGFTADAESERGEARADLSVRGLRLDYHGQPVEGDATIDLRLPVLELDSDRYSLAGTSMRLDSSRLDPPWSGSVRLDDGWLRPGASPYLFADAGVEMRDSRIVLGMFLAQRDLPRWINKVVDVQPFSGRARLSLSPASAAVGPFELGGEHAEVEGLVLLEPSRQRGALLVGYRALHLGVELGPGGRDLKLLRAERWFESAFPPLVARAERRRGGG